LQSNGVCTLCIQGSLQNKKFDTKGLVTMKLCIRHPNRFAVLALEFPEDPDDDALIISADRSSEGAPKVVKDNESNMVAHRAVQNPSPIVETVGNDLEDDFIQVTHARSSPKGDFNLYFGDERVYPRRKAEVSTSTTDVMERAYHRREIGQTKCTTKRMKPVIAVYRSACQRVAKRQANVKGGRSRERVAKTNQKTKKGKNNKPNHSKKCDPRSPYTPPSHGDDRAGSKPAAKKTADGKNPRRGMRIDNERFELRKKLAESYNYSDEIAPANAQEEGIRQLILSAFSVKLHESVERNSSPGRQRICHASAVSARQRFETARGLLSPESRQNFLRGFTNTLNRVVAGAIANISPIS
jgi:hypothetical protein